MRAGHIITICVIVLLTSCSTTRYVPAGKYLLARNVVEVKNDKGVREREMISEDNLAGYIKQRPNRKLLGMNYALAFYNMTDTTKHNWWHNFWRDKVGSAPVIFDSTLMMETSREMQIYLGSRGFLNATVTDSVEFKDKKAIVRYNVRQNKPYKISYVSYNIEDPYVGSIVLQDTAKSLLKVDEIFDRQMMQNERNRITKQLRDRGFYYFTNSSINYTADSSWNDNTVSVQLNIKKRLAGYASANKPIYTNHPIYRIKKIVINTDFNPTNSIEQNQDTHYDTITHRGVDIVYSGRLQIKADLLVSSLRISPNSIYNETLVQRSNTNIRDLGYNTTILFSPMSTDSTQTKTIEITNTDSTTFTTLEGELMCLIQCTPIKSQSITEEFEISTTAAYSSIALTLGYQNRNLFGGAENFTTSVRGAFELVKTNGKQNSYELGVTSSLSLPRLLLPIGGDRLGNIRQKSTKLQLNYNIQERPDYHRTILGVVYGYNWTMPNGSRIAVNPVDINVVNVPWIDSTFIANIENPYLRNSYQSQMIAGLSASYFYGSTPRYQDSGYSFRIMTDTNGNLISLVEQMAAHKRENRDGEEYETLLGLRYAQYARASFDYSQRQTLNNRAQLAWRIFIGVGIPYGNSSVVPFERLFFAGGSNSMRGWQIRTLGPGGTPYPTDNRYPNQLGDMRLEANLEFRYNIWNGLNMALFFDAGNVWMNSKGRESDAALFRLNTFYKQVALNTGAGLRWDFDIFLIRLDWGLKLHSPDMPTGHRWFSQMGFADTVFHFAIGLPF